MKDTDQITDTELLLTTLAIGALLLLPLIQETIVSALEKDETLEKQYQEF